MTVVVSFVRPQGAGVVSMGRVAFNVKAGT